MKRGSLTGNNNHRPNRDKDPSEVIQFRVTAGGKDLLGEFYKEAKNPDWHSISDMYREILFEGLEGFKENMSVELKAYAALERIQRMQTRRFNFNSMLDDTMMKAEQEIHGMNLLDAYGILQGLRELRAMMFKGDPKSMKVDDMVVGYENKVNELQGSQGQHLEESMRVKIRDGGVDWSKLAVGEDG